MYTPDRQINPPSFYEKESNTSLAMCSCGRMVEVSDEEYKEGVMCDRCKENEVLEEENN